MNEFIRHRVAGELFETGSVSALNVLENFN